MAWILIAWEFRSNIAWNHQIPTRLEHHLISIEFRSFVYWECASFWNSKWNVPYLASVPWATQILPILQSHKQLQFSLRDIRKVILKSRIKSSFLNIPVYQVCLLVQTPYWSKHIQSFAIFLENSGKVFMCLNPRNSNQTNCNFCFSHVIYFSMYGDIPPYQNYLFKARVCKFLLQYSAWSTVFHWEQVMYHCSFFIPGKE